MMPQLIACSRSPHNVLHSPSTNLIGQCEALGHSRSFFKFGWAENGVLFLGLRYEKLHAVTALYY